MARMPLKAARWALAALAAGAAILLAAYAAGEIARGRVLDQLRDQAETAADLHAEVLRSELEKQRALPFVLAEDADVAAALRTRDPRRLADLNLKLERLSRRTRAAVIYVLDARGNAVAASNWRLPSSFVGSNYAFRPYFRDALRAGSAKMFALGTVSNRPGLFLSRRVEGAPGVVVVKAEFDALEAQWRRSGDPAFVSDAARVVLITSEPAWRFRTVVDPARLTGGPRGAFVAATAAAASPGWTMHVLTPSGRAVGAAVATARLAGAASALLLLILASALWRGRTRAARREAEREAARLQLESQVERRTRDLSSANARVVAEVEERRRSEAAAQTLQDELVQANKLATLGQIAAGVAHEINQPVAAIRAYADNAAAFLDKRRPDAARDNLASIADLTERIGAITDELRAFSRKSSRLAEPTSLQAAVDGALLLLGAAIREAGATVERRGDFAVDVLAGRVRLAQVLVNLLQNAADAVRGRPGGRVRLEVRRSAGRVRISVQDNGPGLSPAIAADLFTPFTTSKPDGLGLGLVISRDIVADFGGELTFEAAADGGAVFHIDLKASD